MKILIVTLVLALSVACAGKPAPALPDTAYLTAVEAKMLVAVGRAQSALETAKQTADRVQTILDVTPLPERLKATVTPILERFEASVVSAQNALASVKVDADVDRLLAEVVTARTALVNTIRLYPDLRIALEILDRLPSDVQ